MKNGTDAVKRFEIKTAGGVQMFDGDTQNIQALLSTLDELPMIVEIGTWTGHSAVILALHAKQSNGHVICIDKFDGTGSVLKGVVEQEVDVQALLEENLKNADVTERVTIYKGASDDFYKDFPDKSIDFLFIDGDHRYAQVCKDIDNYLPKVRGIICGHDYDIDAWNVVMDNAPYVFNEEYKEKDCEFLPYKGQAACVHHGVAQAVRERFGEVEHYGRIWFKDLRKK